MFVIGGPQHPRQTLGPQHRDQLDNSLRARQGHHRGQGSIGLGRRVQQARHRSMGWQGAERLGRECRYGIGHAVDAGRQVNPIHPAIGGTGLFQIAAVIAHTHSAAPTKMPHRASIASTKSRKPCCISMALGSRPVGLTQGSTVTSPS